MTGKLNNKKKKKRVIDSDDPQAGDREAIKASEEVMRRNITSVMMHGNETRRGLLALREMFDALQANVISMNNEMKQMRSQLSVLQGEFYKRGTTSYTEAPADEDSEVVEDVPDRSQGEGAPDKRISFP